MSQPSDAAVKRAAAVLVEIVPTLKPNAELIATRMLEAALAALKEEQQFQAARAHASFGGRS